jgi:hypothetical protein
MAALAFPIGYSKSEQKAFTTTLQIWSWQTGKAREIWTQIPGMWGEKINHA